MPGYSDPKKSPKGKKVRVKKDAKNPFIESKPKPTREQTLMANVKNSKKKKLIKKAY